jgi:hypothetical protein
MVGVVATGALLAVSTQAARAGVLAVRYSVVEERHVDELVFTFEGPSPGVLHAGYVKVVHTDASGLPVHLEGHAFFAIQFFPAQAFGANGMRSGAAISETPRLALIRQVKPAGSFEGYLSYGVGLSRHTSYRVERRHEQIVIQFRR